MKKRTKIGNVSNVWSYEFYGKKMKVKIHLVEYKFLSIPFSLLLFSSYGPGREEEKENKSITWKISLHQQATVMIGNDH
jgi:hypothetical protein